MNPGIHGFGQAHCFSTPPQAVTAGQTTYSLPLDRPPDLITLKLVNVTAEWDWLPGDEIDALHIGTNDGAGNYFDGFGVGYSRVGDGVRSAGLTIFVNVYTGALYIFSKYTGAGVPRVLTAGNWLLKANCIWFHP